MSHEYSYGAIIFTRSRGEMRFVVIRSLEGVYGFPKGHIEPGETPVQAALREIKEEVGLTPRLIPGFRTEKTYPLPKKPDVTKHVIFFLAEYDGQEIIPQREELSWAGLMTRDEAMKSFQHGTNRQALESAMSYINSPDMEYARELPDPKRVRAICDAADDRIRRIHISRFEGIDEPLFLISETYPGVWLEHAYDSVYYAKLRPEYLYVAENTINLFIDRQTDEGQLPFAVWRDGTSGYSQIQECVPFYRLCLMVYEMNRSAAFLKKIYESGRRWDQWLRKYRMSTNRGLIEMFYGYDTGHDNSGRLEGMSCPGNYQVDGERMNAKTLPPQDGITPILAVDMNAVFFGDEMALSEMARLLGREGEAEAWAESARRIREKLFEHCYDEEDAFFYDVDRAGRKRKYLSSTIFHLFLSGVLNPEKDRDLIRSIYNRHIKNPDEFWTPYPFPSMAVSDPSCVGHGTSNCWGYYTMGLIALRCSLWMDDYGMCAEYDRVCGRWLEGWTRHFDEVPLGQELDPITGEPTRCSPWYSSGMLAYIGAAKRLGLWEPSAQ